MKNKKLWLAILVVLPILASGFTGMPNAVLVWDTAMETVTYYSFFELLPEGTIRIATMASGVLTCAAAVLAINYAVTKKRYMLTGVLATSFLGTLAAVAPIVFRQELLVVPNVAVPLMLISECLFAYHMRKHHDPAEEKQTHPTRLK